MIKINELAPDFTLKNEFNEEITLSSLRGQKIILYFYPKDFTSGCSVQATSFALHQKDFKELGYKIIGISKDTTTSHSRFILKHDLNFMLLSDHNKKVLEQYGLLKEKTMYGRKVKGTRRTTIIIDEDGFIRDIFYDVKPRTSTKELLTYLRSKA